MGLVGLISDATHQNDFKTERVGGHCEPTASLALWWDLELVFAAEAMGSGGWGQNIMGW